MARNPQWWAASGTPNGETLCGLLKDSAEPGLTVYTDGAATSRRTESRASGSILKRAHIGTLLYLSPTHLPRHIHKFCDRYNHG